MEEKRKSKKWKMKENKKYPYRNKTIYLSILILAVMLLGVGTTSATLKSYDEPAKTITLSSNFLFINTGKIATVTLATPIDNVVGMGYQEVAELDITGFKNYNDLISTFDFYDIRNLNEKIDRQIDLRVKTIKNVKVNDYKNVQVGTYPNGTAIYESQVSGFHFEDKVSWVLLENSDIKADENLTIGIFTDVKPYDRVEWIPTIAGLKITYWATWTASLNVGLTSYYKLDDNAANKVVLDSLFTNNGTANANTNTFYNASGKIGSAFKFNGTGAFVSGMDKWEYNDFSMNSWIWIDSEASTNSIYTNRRQADANAILSTYEASNTATLLIRDNSGGGIKGVSTAAVIATGRWYMLTVTYLNSTGNMSIYLNGTLQATDTYSGGTWATVDNIYLGGRNAGGTPDNFMDGLIDEVGVWNRTLTQVEVTQLWNGGNGITYSITFGPTITLNSPVDAYNTISGDITFNGTSNSGSVMANTSLIIDNTYNSTNTSGINGDYIFTPSTIADGTHTWTIESCDDIQCNNGTARTFTIDSTAPTINVSYPNETIGYMYESYNLTLNFTATDLNLGACIWIYNGTNTTFPCTTATLSTNYFDYEKDKNNGTLWANDTSGNSNQQTVTWDYKIFRNSLTYTTPELSGATSTFAFNVSRNPAYSVLIPYINYNGTSYSTSSSLSGNDYYFTKDLTVPYVSTTQNATFNWALSLNDSSLVNSSDYNQTLNNLTFDGCGVNSIVIFNFTLGDEDTLTQIINTTIDYNFDLYSEDRSTYFVNVSNTSTTNPTLICISNELTSSSKYSLDGTVKYHGNSSFIDERYYNFLNYTIANSTVPRNISLYTLNISRSIPFQLTFRDSNLVLSPKVLVNVQRQYVSQNGAFKTVEIPITDSNGQTVVNLVRNTEVYNFIMTDITGNVVGSFNKVTAFCQDYTIGSCTLELNAAPALATLYNFTEKGGISYTLSYSNSTKVITLTFNSLNSSIPTVRMIVNSQNQFENTTICDSSLATSTGSITCNATTAALTNSFLYVNIYSNGNFIGYQVINLLNNGLGGNFGVDGLFIAFLLILLVICVFNEDKQTLVIMLGIGWVVVVGFGLVKGSIFGATQIATGGIWLIITILILLWKLKDEEGGV